MKNRTLTLSCVFACLLFAGPLQAQDREAEIRELERLLVDTERALDATRPLYEPKLEVVFYDVRQLYARPDDRAAPSLSIPSDAAGFRTGEGAPVGGSFSFDDEEEECGSGVDSDRLIELIESKLGEEDEDGSVETSGGILIVRKSARAHAKIRQLLAAFREAQLRSIQLEVAFYVLPDALQSEIVLAARRNRGVLDAKALARLDAAVAQSKARLARKALLTALSQQRVFLHHGTERAYVNSYRQVSGGDSQAVTVAVPQVDVLRAGLALDMRPTLLSLGRVALDVRLVRSHAKAMTQRKTRWGPLEIPEVTVSSVRTSAKVPGGSGMLVFSTRGSSDPSQPDVTIVVRPRVTSLR